MPSRGRKSAAAKSALATMITLEQGVRPEPPENLEPAEANVWYKIVNGMPPDWFPVETHTLLELYCKQTAGLVFIDKAIARIQKSPNPNMGEWRKLVSVRRLECKSIAMLATKMRLAQQSSYDMMQAKAAKARGGVAKTLPAVKSVAPARPWS